MTRYQCNPLQNHMIRVCSSVCLLWYLDHGASYLRSDLFSSNLAHMIFEDSTCLQLGKNQDKYSFIIPCLTSSINSNFENSHTTPYLSTNSLVNETPVFTGAFERILEACIHMQEEDQLCKKRSPNQHSLNTNKTYSGTVSYSGKVLEFSFILV